MKINLIKMSCVNLKRMAHSLDRKRILLYKKYNICIEFPYIPYYEDDLDRFIVAKMKYLEAHNLSE